MFPDTTNPMEKRADVSGETFDEFLASLGLLEACEDHAIREIIAEQKVGAASNLDGTK
jgi:hypothetical protein